MGGFFKKRNMQLPCDPATARLGIYPEKATRTPVHGVHSSCIRYSPKGNWPRCPAREVVGQAVVHPLHGTPPAMRRDGCRQPQPGESPSARTRPVQELLTTRCQLCDTREMTNWRTGAWLPGVRRRGRWPGLVLGGSGRVLLPNWGLRDAIAGETGGRDLFSFLQTAWTLQMPQN